MGEQSSVSEIGLTMAPYQATVRFQFNDGIRNTYRICTENTNLSTRLKCDKRITFLHKTYYIPYNIVRERLVPYYLIYCIVVSSPRLEIKVKKKNRRYPTTSNKQ